MLPLVQPLLVVLLLLLPIPLRKVDCTVSMILLNCQEDLVLLQKELENLLPLSLKVYGSVLRILRGNTFHQEMLVDSWPGFNVVLVRPQKKEDSNDFDSYRNSYIYFYKDIKHVPESFVEVFDWTQAFEVQGIQSDLEDMLIEAAQKRKTRTERETMLTLWVKEGNDLSPSGQREEKNSHLSSLTLSDAELVDKTWAFGGNENSLRYVKACVKNSLSSCCTIADKESPISWAIMDQNGAIRMAYTMPEHRGKGYGKIVNSSLSELMRKDGIPVHCHVRDDNESSKALYRSLGFEEVIGGTMLFFHSTPLHLVSSERQAM